MESRVLCFPSGFRMKSKATPAVLRGLRMIFRYLYFSEVDHGFFGGLLVPAVCFERMSSRGNYNGYGYECSKCGCQHVMQHGIERGCA